MSFLKYMSRKKYQTYVSQNEQNIFLIPQAPNRVLYYTSKIKIVFLNNGRHLVSATRKKVFYSLSKLIPSYTKHILFKMSAAYYPTFKFEASSLSRGPIIYFFDGLNGTFP